MPWRKITAEKYRTGADEEGFDEARIVDPHTGFSREVWDVACEQECGKVLIWTAAADPIGVPPDYPISVR